MSDYFIASGASRLAAEALLATPRHAIADALDMLEDRYGGVARYLIERAAMTASTIGQLRSELIR